MIPTLAASALAAVQPVFAQSGEVVQATPSAAAVDTLNRNLALLSRSPQDVNALLGAGQAALDLGDVQAANGFFTRANLVNPRLGKAKLGLAVVQIALKQPAEAAANFDAAAALGEHADGHLAERGLAYDLTGQQEKAQRDYQAAMRLRPDDATARLRYAVSLGISGRPAEADKLLEQPLAAGDREAWRMRAFIYAMNGRIADARKVTQSVMPKGLADALDPYMQRLPLLTPGQKGAAAYYGEFPANVLRLAAPEPAREVQVAAVSERENARSGRRSRSSGRNAQAATSGQASGRGTTLAAASPPPSGLNPPPPPRQVQPSAPQPTAPQPVRSAAVETPVAARPAERPFTPASPPPAQTASAPPQAVRTAAAQPSQTSPSPQQTAPAAPSATTATRDYEAPATVSPAALPASSAPPQPVTTPPPAPQGPADPMAQSPVQTAAAAVAPPPAPGFSNAAEPIASQPRSLAEALSALDVPAEERAQGAAADLEAVRRIQEQRRKTAEAAAAKARAEAEAKAKAEAEKKAAAERKAKLAANPSRSWVQIAAGRDVAALAFDLRRLRRTYADAIGDLSGWTAEWGATNRLLVGPFRKPEDAKAVVAKITRSGGDAFLWQSDAGEEVSKIGGK